jgi:hypothetical protein
MRDLYFRCTSCKRNWSAEELDAINFDKLCEDILSCTCDNNSFEPVLLEDSNG